MTLSKEQKEISNNNFALPDQRKTVESVDNNSCIGNCTRLKDYHFFALLCWRNFATLPELTMIESVQRLVAAKRQTTSDYEVKINGKDKKVTELEYKVHNEESFINGMLWCVTKLFVNEKNFQGNELLKRYKRRLFMTIFIGLASLAVAFLYMPHYTLFFEDNVAEEICCKITTGDITREYSCFLPTTGDLPQLLIGFTCIQGIIILMNLYHVWKFYLRGKFNDIILTVIKLKAVST